MAENGDFVHPYIPNSAPEARRRVLEAAGVADPEEIYAVIPEELRLKRPLDLPPPLLSEWALRRHIDGLLAKNRSCQEHLSFLGGGCWQHYVPAVCDEIGGRAEFLTAYAGDTYSDLGKYQAIFEFQSLLGALVGMEVVSTPTYDWAAAASSSLLMACRITGRKRVLVSEAISWEKKSHMRNSFDRAVGVDWARFDRSTGLVDLDDLAGKISDETAAVYFENPSYFGVIESQGAEISRMAHGRGALSVVGVDPSSLGVLVPPADYGADIVCGDVQPLGNHMHCGGGLCGFIASRDEERFVAEYPTVLISLAPTREGEGWGFGWSTMERTSYAKREQSPDYIGTTQWLWGITAAVYMALMGPQGMRELGEAVLHKAHYAQGLLSSLEGVTAPLFSATGFKEFVVHFHAPGKRVADINRALLRKGIYGGKDLSQEFPDLGQSALYCVTEIHSQEEIERLARSLEEVLG